VLELYAAAPFDAPVVSFDQRDHDRRIPVLWATAQRAVADYITLGNGADVGGPVRREVVAARAAGTHPCVEPVAVAWFGLWSRRTGFESPRPDTHGVPLTRWSLDRLSALLAEHDLLISPIDLWRLLYRAGLTGRRLSPVDTPSPLPHGLARAARWPLNASRD
jgi:hypothetical protein